MRISVSIDEEDLIYLVVEGDVGVSEVSEFDRLVRRHIVFPCKQTVVNLSDVTSLASICVRSLFKGARSLARGKKKIVFFKPLPEVETALRSDKCESNMLFTHDENEAAEAVGIR